MELKVRSHSICNLPLIRNSIYISKINFNRFTMSYHQINLRNKTKLPKVIVNLLRGAAHCFVSDVDPQLRCTS